MSMLLPYSHTVILLLSISHSGWTRKSEPQLEQAEQGLFRGSDRYHFAIEVPATHMDCFWHFAHQSGNFYLTYMVQWVTGMATDRRLMVSITSPDGFLVTTSNDAVGTINFETKETGFYQMCLGNFHNRFGGVRVFLNFGVYYKGFEETKKQTEKEGAELNNTLSSIELSTVKLQYQIVHMWRYYNYARMRRGSDHYLLLSNNSYVMWWSAAQSAAIVLSGCLQLYGLKRLFHATTDTHRPTC